MQDYDGVVGIYSLNNPLSEKLKDNFSQKYLDVKVFEDFSKVDLGHLSYLILNLIDTKPDMSKLLSVVKNIECKILLLHPLFIKKSEKFVRESELKNFIETNPNLGVLLVPEILGDNVSYNPDYVSHSLIMQTITSERVKITSDSLLVNTVSLNKLADRIVRDTFSFGVSGSMVSIIGLRKSKRIFATKYLGVKEENMITLNEESNISELYSNSSVQVDFSLSLAIRKTKNFFLKTTSNIESEVKENEKGQSLMPVQSKNQNKVTVNRSVKKGSLKLKRILKILLVLLLLSFTPIYLLVVSVVLLYSSSKIALSNNSLSNKLIVKSVKTADMARSLSFGSNLIYDFANIVYGIGSIGSEGITLINSGREFVDQITSENEYDLSFYSNKISASLDKIHTDISFLQSDVNEQGGFSGNYVKKMLVNRNIDINEYKNKIYDSKNLFSRISVLLGVDKPKKYLVLFQNNMELRPTGGFIGSFALITFNRGRLSEIVVNDVYSADGQLKGHVDPPEPIRKHLGEGGWYLRDSNWNPDFPTSATKAEWFLDKELSENVDGVVAIDLYFIKRLLTVTGPIRFNDFNMTVDSNNLYQLIQSEVEDEFFPGSIKKATILTSLTQTLIMEVEHLDGKKYINFFKEIYESLERKHIQISFHDTNAQEAISNLGYSGEIDISTECGLRCLNDSYSLIDANLGVNKSNYFIKRSHQLNVSVAKEFIGHELYVTYENSASPSIGNMGVYKNYARMILPLNAKVGGVRMYETSGSYSELEFDIEEVDGREEVGFLFELLPGSQKRIQIAWNIEENKLSQGGEYNLKIIKQAGTDADDLVVNVKPADLALTGNSFSSYNTTLAKNFKVKLFFKQ